jgi:hypothetical protein
MCVGSMQTLTHLFKGLEHLQILVSAWGTNPLWILRTNCIQSLPICGRDEICKVVRPENKSGIFHSQEKGLQQLPIAIPRLIWWVGELILVFIIPRLPDTGCRWKWALWRNLAGFHLLGPAWASLDAQCQRRAMPDKRLHRVLMEFFSIQAEFLIFLPKSTTLWFNICWVVINST